LADFIKTLIFSTDCIKNYQYKI